MNNLEILGFDNWFWSSSVRSPSDIPSGKLARVISVNKNTQEFEQAG